MSESATIFAPDSEPLTIAVLVLPQASILEVASVLDPMRSANRHLGTDAYCWRVVSPDGRAVPLTCAIELPSTGALASAAGADALIVIAGFRQAEVATRPLIRDLRRIAPSFRAIGGVDAGGWVLARAGLLEGRRATVHWEDHEDFAAAHPGVTVVPDRFVISGARFTAGGAAPACDLMLHLIAARHGRALARMVAESFITRGQDGADAQQAAPHAPHPSGSSHVTLPRTSVPHTAPGSFDDALPEVRRRLRIDGRVTQALARIDATIDQPEPATATARAVGLSPRRLEGLFRSEIGMTPGAYALLQRLQAARRMVTDTHHPLTDVALRCGFSSAATFSRAFRRQFGMAPSSLRRQH